MNAIAVHIESDADIVSTIARLYSEGMEKGKEQHIEAGQKLEAQKDALKHGHWIPWINANKDRLGFGLWTANRLRHWAKHPELTAREVWGNNKRAKDAKGNCGSTTSLPDARSKAAIPLKAENVPAEDVPLLPASPQRSHLTDINEHIQFVLTGKDADGNDLIEMDAMHLAEAIAELLASGVDAGYRVSKDDIRKAFDILVDQWDA